MFLAGLMRLSSIEVSELDRLLTSLLPELSGSVCLVNRQVNQISGWSVNIDLPHQHKHRTLKDISELILASELNEEAKRLAIDTFTLLAETEARVHQKKPEEIHFHEVGSLDSILDICLTCELFTRVSPGRFVVSPLPIADGSVTCAHGILPVPAPAVLELLEGIPICSFPGKGETITPTAIALLRTLGAEFGSWPDMTVEKQTLVYGSRVFPDAPNGTIFASGSNYAPI